MFTVQRLNGPGLACRLSPRPSEIYTRLCEKPIAHLVQSLRAAAENSGNPLIQEVLNYALLPKRKYLSTMLARDAYFAAGGKNRAVADDVSVFTGAVNVFYTLYDDVIDDHQTRFNLPSPQAKFGKEQTLLSAYYLLNFAFGVISKYHIESIPDLGTVISGWVEKDLIRGKDFQRCTGTIEKLSAAHETFCRIAAEAAQASTNTQTFTANFGFNLGCAASIIDECRDTAGLFGRPAAEELKKGDDLWIMALALKMGYDLRNSENPWFQFKQTRAYGQTREYIFERLDRATQALAELDDTRRWSVLETSIALLREEVLSWDTVLLK